MQCVEYRDELRAEWQEFVERQPCACLGHDIAWKPIITDSLGHEPKYMLAMDGGRVRGVLPLFRLRHIVLGKRLVSIPVADQAGILAEDEEARRLLSDRLREESERANCKFAQLRCRAEGDCDPPPRKAVMVLPIADGPDVLWKGFKQSLRNQVRKSEKSGVQALVGGAELLPEFFKVYSGNMRDLGVPALPYSLFEHTMAAFGERARVVLATLDGNPVGTCIMIKFKETAAVPWASSCKDFLWSCPNHTLYWTAIKHAASCGCKVFDFGRSTWQSGPFAFKVQWGAVPVALNWEYIMSGGESAPNFTTDNPKFRIMVRAWQRLPVPVANALGPIISRQVA